MRDWLFYQSHRKISTTNWCFHWNLSPYTQDPSLKPKNIPQKAFSIQRWPRENRSSKAQSSQDERGHFLSSVLHPSRRGDEGFLQPLHETGDDGGKSKSSREAPDTLNTRHWGQPAYKKQALPILFRVRSKAINRWNASLCWSFRSTKYSTLSKINHGSGARNHSNITLRSPNWRNTAPTTKAKDIRLSTTGPCESTWRSL